ncbi:MAG: cupredoxin domain-containing protein [Chloroflexi bacterium]|nr:cupredoxin domain-containing protein [Chloroflexota bacterium]MCZ7579028.1 cupredoxin domain-containing protein [Dehalococcoidia bacterium]
MKLWELRRLGLLVASAALVAGVAAACGGDDDDTNGNGTVAATASTSAQATVPEGAPVVDQDKLKFGPGELKVKVGEKVYFTNSETALHTVDINGVNESGNMKKGDVFSFEFAAPGEYKITCAYHPQMKATIIVE